MQVLFIDCFISYQVLVVCQNLSKLAPKPYAQIRQSRLALRQARRAQGAYSSTIFAWFKPLDMKSSSTQ